MLVVQRRGNGSLVASGSCLDGSLVLPHTHVTADEDKRALAVVPESGGDRVLRTMETAVLEALQITLAWPKSKKRTGKGGGGVLNSS